MKLSVPVLERISNETWTSRIRLLVVSSIVFSVLWARICEVDSWLDDLRETEVSRQLAREGGSVPCQCGKSAGKLPVPSPLCTSSIPKVFFFFLMLFSELKILLPLKMMGFLACVRTTQNHSTVSLSCGPK